MIERRRQYRAKHKETNTIVAMKKIRLDDEEEGVPSTALREISVLMELGTSTGVGSECVVRYVLFLSPLPLLSWCWISRRDYRGPGKTATRSEAAEEAPHVQCPRFVAYQTLSILCPANPANPHFPFLPFRRRLLDVIHSDARLCLVFEFLDLDLKKYMDSASAAADMAEASLMINGLPMDMGSNSQSSRAKGKGRARRGLPADLVAVSTSRPFRGVHLPPPSCAS